MAELLHEELEPGDPFHDYARRLNEPSLRQSMRGYLAGSIDLVLRATGGEPAQPAPIAAP